MFFDQYLIDPVSEWSLKPMKTEGNYLGERGPEKGRKEGQEGIIYVYGNVMMKPIVL